MKKICAALLLACGVLPAAFAQSDVFLCVDAQGNKEYRNTGSTKGCKRVDLQGISLIPSPYKKPLVQTAARSPARDGVTPASFPRVSNDAQKARDNDRLQILMREMKTEEDKMARLREEYKGGEPDRLGSEKNYAKYQERAALLKENLNRTEKNIEALQREIRNLK